MNEKFPELEDAWLNLCLELGRVTEELKKVQEEYPGLITINLGSANVQTRVMLAKDIVRILTTTNDNDQ